MTAGHVRQISGATPRLPSASTTKRVHWYFGCSRAISVYIDFKGKRRATKKKKMN